MKVQLSAVNCCVQELVSNGAIPKKRCPVSTERRSPSSDAQPASVKATILVGAVCSANCQAHSSLSTKYLAMCLSSVRCFTWEHEKPRHATTHRKLDVGSVPCVVENRSCRATVCASVLILKIVFEVAQLTSCAVFLPGQYLIPRVGAGSLVSTSSPNSSITARARFTSVCQRTPPGLYSMILLKSFTWKHLWGPMIPSLLALEVLGQHQGEAVQNFGHTSGSGQHVLVNQMPEHNRHGPQDEAAGPMRRELHSVSQQPARASCRVHSPSKSPAEPWSYQLISVGKMHKNHLVHSRVWEAHGDVEDSKACARTQKSCSAHHSHQPEEQQRGRALCHDVSSAASGAASRHEAAPARREPVVVLCPAPLHMSPPGGWVLPRRLDACVDCHASMVRS